MSFMGTASRAARAAAELAAPAAGAAAVVAAAPPARAREGGASGAYPLSALARIQDDFQLVDVEGGVVITKPALITEDEVAGAVGAIREFMGAADGDSDTSEGDAADAVIEAGPVGGPLGRGRGGALSAARAAEFDAALAIATRLLRSPGVQRELVTAALTDPLIIEALGARPDIGGYLHSQGFAPRGLLPMAGADSSAAAAAAPPPAQSATVTELHGAWDDPGGVVPLAGGAGRDPLACFVADVASGIEWVRERAAQLGAWLGAQLLGLDEPRARSGRGGHVRAGEERVCGGDGGAGAQEEEAEDEAAAARDTAGRRLRAAMRVAAAVVVVVLFRRAGLGAVLRALARRGA